MENCIGFFSSDARNLYIDDVYRVMALPQNYTIKFRYQKKYILDELCINMKDLIDKEAIIFFSQGNDIDNNDEEKPINNYSLRKATIKQIVDDIDTQLVYFYLSLGEFFEFNINETEKKYLPPYKFVTRITGNTGTRSKWTERIDDIKSSFKDILFFNINGITDSNNKVIKPDYSDSLKESFYDLNDEKEYHIKILLYETNYVKSKGKNYFDIEQESKYITIYKQKKLSIGAIKDFINISMVTHTLDIPETISYLNIFTCLNEENQALYDIYLKFKIKRKKYKSILFGFLSSLLAIGLFLGQFVIVSTASIQFNKCVYLLIIIVASLLIGLSSILLYKIYNKK